mmetsp:Transcript_14750/g.22039  ORF Transcript_14750/g.22039 Transcript_14750/m.22039 type:complete len:200 (-) Transcript_14750:39-638(-)
MDNIKTLMTEKDKIETEIETLQQVLTTHGFQNPDKKLVDVDGFPLHDLGKVLSVRQARHRIACLQTDHKLLMQKIEKLLFSSFPSKQSSTSSSSSSTSSNINQEKVATLVQIKSVSANSILCSQHNFKPGFLIHRIGSIRPRQRFQSFQHLLDSIHQVIQSKRSQSLLIQFSNNTHSNQVHSIHIKVPDDGQLGCTFQG